jgi:uncharacterized protein YecE (DUF72 family)
MMTGRAWIGCSGWSYKDWRGRVYPQDLPTRGWFAAYAEHFDTVEINNTFYRLPPASTVDGWARQAPDGFVYAVKMGGFGSHRKKLKDPEGWLARHVDVVGRLGEHLGPNLVQLPPHWKRDVGRLDHFLEVVPKDWRWVVEVRDPSWLHRSVYECLRRHGVALCLHDMLDGHPRHVTADFVYLRFHGPHAPEHSYHGHYGGRRLGPRLAQIERWLDDGLDVYAYFNNDYGGAAFDDATWLRDHLCSTSGLFAPVAPG